MPQPSELMQFYSIFIGRKNLAALKIFGTVEFSFHGNPRYLFKRACDEAIEVEDSQKVLPFLEVYKSFSDYGLLELKVDLKDVRGKYQNKGFATYDLRFPCRYSSYNTQICSVLPGKDGFCALHYSIFPRACQANIEIFFKIKSAQLGAGKIYGSAIARYSNFDYSTKLKRDYFRCVLFQTIEKDPVHLKNDEEELISKSVVVVPMDASLIIDVDFFCMSPKDRLLGKRKFKIGDCCFQTDTETKNYEFCIEITWTDGLHDGQSELHKHEATNDMPKLEMEAAE
ncbi:unnamed protein product [Cuscuta campestris]|uniref:DUF6598 domain-containing protein n=1 Tax=Cuscuta campestris TaxID=132261 RepID=A0A484L1K9_9ASTE|nr:unnamed protein product [Cuscuta campestris]